MRTRKQSTGSTRRRAARRSWSSGPREQTENPVKSASSRIKSKVRTRVKISWWIPTLKAAKTTVRSRTYSISQNGSYLKQRRQTEPSRIWKKSRDRQHSCRFCHSRDCLRLLWIWQRASVFPCASTVNQPTTLKCFKLATSVTPQSPNAHQTVLVTTINKRSLRLTYPKICHC